MSNSKVEVSKPIIRFTKDTHTYTTDGLPCYSANTVKDYFKDPMDIDYWEYYKALELCVPNFKELKKQRFKYPDIMKPPVWWLDELRGMLPEYMYNSARERIQDLWQASRDDGTEFHDMMEQKMYKDGYAINPWDKKSYPVKRYHKDYDNQSITNDLSTLEDGCYPELLVYMRVGDVMITGQADVVYIDGKYSSIDDFKGLELSTPIATPKGYTKIKDIKVGDKVYNGKGKLTRVKHVSEIHNNPCYKIKFDNNDEITCDHEHRWVITESVRTYKKGKVKYKNIDSELTTEEIFNNIQTKGVKYKIKNTCIKSSKKDLPIDPYVLGIWLADGNSCAATLTCVNQDIWDEIINRGYEVSINHSRHNDKAESRTIFGISKGLRKLNLLRNKHIPDIYLRSSKVQRMDLLRGFMDGDGYFNRSRNRCVMQTTKEWQYKDLSKLISSLGFKPTVIPYKGSGFGKSNIQMYSLNFTPTENPFLCRNKDYIEVIGDQIGKYSTYRYINSVERVDTVPTRCIAVEGEEKTYLAGYNNIKTHNTNKKFSKSKSKTMYHEPFSHLDTSKFTNYAVQMSIYQYILECSGFIPRNIGLHHYKNYDPKTAKKYDLPYLKDEVKGMIELFAEIHSAK